MRELGKQRVYTCSCGARPCRPLRASDGRPYPKPCDVCAASLLGRPFVIEDMVLFVRKIIAAEAAGGDDV